MQPTTPTPQRRRRTRRWAVIAILAVLCLAAASLLFPVRPLPLTISRETTYLLEPRTADGRIDYLAALNARLRDGVTAENNAAMSLFGTFGSLFTRRDALQATLEALGRSQLPPNTKHFTPLGTFQLRPGEVWTPDEEGDWPLEPDPQDAEAIKTLTSTWLADHHERISQWLDANQEPLDSARKATKRPRLWRPLIPPGAARLVTVALTAHPQDMLRGVSRALGCRAMRSLFRGERMETWEDLRAALALAALAPQEGGGLAYAVGFAMETDLLAAMAALLGDERFTVGEARLIGSEIESLPPVRKARECAADERLSVLDHVQALTMQGGLDLGEVGLSQWPMPRGLDPDTALRTVNLWFDDVERALGVERFEQRRDAVADLLRRLEARIAVVRSGTATLPGWIAMAVRGPAERRRRFSEMTATLVVSLLVPTLVRTHEIETVRTARRTLWRVGAALAAHRAEKGSYPETLEALVPAWLPALPTDPVKGGPFDFRRAQNGYRLAWLGLDGKPDPAPAAADTALPPGGDDLVLSAPRG